MGENQHTNCEEDPSKDAQQTLGAARSLRWLAVTRIGKGNLDFPDNTYTKSRILPIIMGGRHVSLAI